MSKQTRFRLEPSLLQFGTYDGVLMHCYDEPPEVHVPKVMNMSLRDTDIILLAYPKAGSHWVWRVLDMLAAGSTAYNDRDIETSNLDVMPIEVLDKVSADIRRIIHTHYPGDLLPTQIKEGRVKVVHVYRNPKAALVSMLFHFQKLKEYPGLTMEQLMDLVFAEKAPYRNLFYYLDTIKKYEHDNPNVDIFHLAYEDMKKDTAGCVKQLATHLNIDASDKLCASIAEAVSFSTQKKNEESGSDWQKGVQTYRKGLVDDWKNHMTVAQSERMDKAVADRAASCQFCRRYCPTITTDQGHALRLTPTS